jgi:hypothetical protein
MIGTAQPAFNSLGGIGKDFVERGRQVVDAARIRADVERMPAPRNRLHSARAMEEADRILIESFTASGWMADMHAFDLKDVRGCLDFEDGRFPAGARPVIYPRLIGANILALKPGIESTDLVVVGAHHDTIRDSPGADDNTASVAALMELARLLQPYSFRHTILLAAFDMEELNLIGSRELVRLITRERKVRGAIIFETMSYSTTAPNTQEIPWGLGRLYPKQVKKIRNRQFRGDWTAVLYRQSAFDIAKVFGEALIQMAGPEAAILLRDLSELPIIGPVLRVVSPLAHFNRSDHFSFWEAGIPAIMVTDTANFRNPNYHLPSDTSDTLDYERVAAIVQAAAITVAELAGLRSGEAEPQTTSGPTP